MRIGLSQHSFRLSTFDVRLFSIFAAIPAFRCNLFQNPRFLHGRFRLPLVAVTNRPKGGIFSKGFPLQMLAFTEHNLKL